MHAIEKYEQIIHRLKEAFEDRYIGKFPVKMFGILFAPPHTKLAQEEILPRLSYLHHRSGNEIDFFCMGYSSEMEIFEHKHSDLVVGKVTSNKKTTTWSYSDEVFNNLRSEFSQKTTWKYSGESDLLLLNAIFDYKFGSVVIDFSKVICLTLNRTIIDNPNFTVGELFERICEFAENTTSDEPTNKFRDISSLRVFGHSFIDSVAENIKNLPVNLFRRAIHFQVKSIEKKNSILKIVPDV